ncbi:MAG: MFS transporter [Rhodospirillales bacterium]|nr:MFS transporter [Rhodospirillales bacterium]
MRDRVGERSAQLSLGLSCLGHMYSHLFAPIFYVVVLTLDTELGLSHGEAVGLIVAGNVLYGVAAPIAGWLGDRWRSTAMIGLFFVGTGGGMVLTGFAATPFQIAAALAVTGLFASIYHPVGIAWLVRNARTRGMALGINGVFGSLGPAVAALTAGILIDTWGWRSAFLVPGAVVLATGAVFFWLVYRGSIVETREDRRPDPPATSRDTARAFAVLAVTLLCSGLIYQSTQPALPKIFSERLVDVIDQGVGGVSMLVAIVYLTSGAMQVLAGHLADRYPLKTVYLSCYVLQVPFLVLAAGCGGAGLVLVAMIMVSVNVGALPAENSLVARYAPSRWRGLAFGLKFILAFGISGFGVKLEGMLYDLTGDFWWLFMVLAGIAVVGVAAAALLPTERREPIAVAAE